MHNHFDVIDDSRVGNVLGNYDGNNRLPATGATVNNANSIETPAAALTSHISDHPESPAETKGMRLTHRSRRSAELTADDEQEPVLPATVSKRRSRWSKTNVQIWGKRSPVSAHGDNDDDSRLWSAETEQADSTDDERLKRAWNKNNFKIWGKRSSSPVGMAQRLMSELRQTGESSHDDYSFLNAPALSNRPLAALSESADPSSSEQRNDFPLGVNEEKTTDNSYPEADNDQELARQQFKRTASGRQSLLGDLLLKRLAGKDTGTWNGSQKGWASNNVRIWG
jgi:hypothetical protein